MDAAAAPAQSTAHVDAADHALPEQSGDAGQDVGQDDPAFRRNFNSFRTAVLDLVGMGDEEAALRKAQRKNHARCEKWKWRFLRRDPAVRFMIDKLKEAGCEVDPEQHITCMTCSSQRGGGFHVIDGVSLCENRLNEKRATEEALVHELLHAYDYCRYKVDWSNLYHHACAEIRAANLSGDCRFMNEFRRGYVGFMGQHIRCVRRRAVKSVVANPNCPDQATAEKAVNRVFISCFNDTTPFEEGHYY